MTDMKKTIKQLSFLLIAAVFLAGFSSISTVSAANNTNLTQVVNGGTLLTDIRDASRVAVASPSFAMSAQTFSFNCGTSTGSVGSNTQRVYLDNPDSADNGWTLTMAATGGVTTLWQNSGSSQNFDFNDPSSCTDGGDADARPGQLTVDPAVSTLTTDCASCAVTSITKGSSAAYSQGVTDSVTLLNAAAGSNDVGRWYLTGVGVSQAIPAEQTVDSYTINLTVTATAS
jgi:hypothetical protein